MIAGHMRPVSFEAPDRNTDGKRPSCTVRVILRTKSRFVRGSENAEDNRRRTLELTADGYALHDRIMAVALERERLLLGDFSSEEFAALASPLRRIHARVPDVSDYQPESEAEDRRPRR
jgi:hypothetical protein